MSRRDLINLTRALERVALHPVTMVVLGLVFLFAVSEIILS